MFICIVCCCQIASCLWRIWPKIHPREKSKGQTTFPKSAWEPPLCHVVNILFACCNYMLSITLVPKHITYPLLSPAKYLTKNLSSHLNPSIYILVAMWLLLKHEKKEEGLTHIETMEVEVNHLHPRISWFQPCTKLLLYVTVNKDLVLTPHFNERLVTISIS